MKKAMLHNGDELTFPDTHTPEQIKAQVKAHLKKKAAEKDEKDKADRTKREALEDSRHKEHVKATMDNVKATQDISKSMLSGLTGLSKKLDHVDDISDALTVLAKNIGSLEKCINSSTESIIKVLKAPRKIVTNTKGKPTGMQIGDE